MFINIQQEPFGLIYKTTNLVNGKIYIGQTVNVKRYLSGKYIGSGILFRQKLIEYGWENFKSELICYANNREELNELEIKYISVFNSIIPNGYNLSLGGDGTSGYRHSEESKQKMSLAFKDRSEEFKQKISLANKGKKHSDEHKQKISLANKGKERSDESKLKYSKASKNRKHSEESKLKMSKSHKDYISVRDNNGKILMIKKDDPRWISRELSGSTKGLVMAKDDKGNKFQISTNDPRYLSGELVHVCKGFQHSKEYTERIKGLIMAKDKSGNKFKIRKDDPRWISGELVGIRSKKFSTLYTNIN